jgi:hypothetical protein
MAKCDEGKHAAEQDKENYETDTVDDGAEIFGESHVHSSPGVRIE